MNTTRPRLCRSLAALAVLAVPTSALARTRASDFNGDGRPDLAVSATFRDNHGGVYIYKGNPGGTYLPYVFADQSFLPGDSPQAGDRFGYALAWGDFDGDGGSDLVIGVPQEDVNGSYVGAIHVYSIKRNLAWFLSPLTPFMCGVQAGCGIAGEGFGSALAAGDFDNDGVDDLAIGAPNTPEGGRAYIMFGQAGYGLNTPGSHFVTLAYAGQVGNSSSKFGSALAAGDLNCDGNEDLAIGAPGQTVALVPNAGQVIIGYAGPSRTWRAFDTWSQNGGANVPSGQTFGDIAESPEADDQFGYSLAIGNFDFDNAAGHSCNELAIGVPLEDVGTQADAGVIQILRGFPPRIMPASNQLFHQDTPGIQGHAEESDLFGFALATTTLGTNPADDLLIGVPGEDKFAGAIGVLFGGQGVGLSSAGNLIISQDSNGVPGQNEPETFGDTFGLCVGGNPGSDLLIGVPGEKNESAGTFSSGWAALLRLDTSILPQFSVVVARALGPGDFGQSPSNFLQFGSAVTGPRPGR